MLPWFRDQFPLYLAPMAGFTDSPFRRRCRALGADVCVTEFVLADAILKGRADVWAEIEFTESERPVGVQLFGADPGSIAEAAALVVERRRPDFIDLNFGCPAPRITDGKAGCALMQDLTRLQAIARAAVDALPGFPVTAKIRLGWDETSIVVDEAAARLEDAGVQAIAIHGRTRAQGYRGDGDLERIVRVAEVRSVPIIANGSIGEAKQVAWLRDETPVRGAMIGRLALGYPWLFEQLAAARDGRPVPALPSPNRRWEALLSYAGDLVADQEKLYGRVTFPSLRARLKAFTKGMPGSARMRNQIEKIESLEALAALREARPIAEAVA